MSNKQLPAEALAAKWNPNDKERQATIYAGNVISFLGIFIKNISSGCNYRIIELDFKKVVYHFEKLSAVIGIVSGPATMWVKANERRPKHDSQVHLKIDGLKRIGNFYEAANGKINLYVNGPEPYTLFEDKFGGVEWLDESGAATAFTQERADLIREANNRDLDGIGYYRHADIADLNAKGDKLALALRRLSRSVQVHPDYLHHQDWKNYVNDGEKALAQWSGEKEVSNG